MLLVRGNTRIADIYMTEFDRVFRHFYFRDIANELAAAKTSDDAQAIFLDETDGWTANYFKPGTLKNNRRIMFFEQPKTTWFANAAAAGGAAPAPAKPKKPEQPGKPTDQKPAKKTTAKKPKPAKKKPVKKAGKQPAPKKAKKKTKKKAKKKTVKKATRRTKKAPSKKKTSVKKASKKKVAKRGPAGNRRQSAKLHACREALRLASRHHTRFCNTVTWRRRRISIPWRRYSAIAELLLENTCRNGISSRARIWREIAASSNCP